MSRHTFYKNDPHWTTAKFNSRCKCGREIKRGDQIWYWPYNKSAECQECGKASEAEFLCNVEDEEAYCRGQGV